MTKYLVSFPSAAMVVPPDEMPAVADASHAVVQEAKDAGVWVFGGGIDERVAPVMVAGDGGVTEATYPQTRQIEGGYAVLEVPTREEALVGGQARGRLPVCAGGPRVLRRPGQLTGGDGQDEADGPPQRAGSADVRSPATRATATVVSTTT